MQNLSHEKLTTQLKSTEYDIIYNRKQILDRKERWTSIFIEIKLHI